MSSATPCLAIDSHTGGEPTRVIIQGGPTLHGSLAEQARQFRQQHDLFRSRVCNEPRGSDVLVGALLTPPTDPSATAGVIFFNNVDVLGMCGHGTIGLVTTLHHLKRITPGIHRIETPVGIVTTELAENGQVSVQNVASFRLHKHVPVQVPGWSRPIHGDIAWGGNWFFITADHGLTLTREQIPSLMRASIAIRQAIESQGLKGLDQLNSGVIDHVELVAPSPTPGCDARNFVLCPGLAYDRSPCGTGTSAKLACLAADSVLPPATRWRQESIIGSVFEGSYVQHNDHIIPTITGQAYVTAELNLHFDVNDPYVDGIR
jgi:4-hydroxyproline epimerase